MGVESIAELSTLLESHAAELDVVSFDIFDTLLERHIEPPDFVKTVAAKKVVSSFLLAEGESLSVDTLLSVRGEVEHELRCRAHDAGYDRECCFAEMAILMARRLSPFKASDLCSHLVAGEIDAELQVLFTKQDMMALLTRLKSNGMRVIAISDMYLDAFLVHRIFEYLGLGNLVDRIYVSSDVKLGKYSGRLFSHVLSSENVLPSRMAHIGDNSESDYAVPKSMGIRAFHLHDRASLRRRQILRTAHWLAQRNPYWRGVFLLRLIPAARKTDFYYRYGYEQLGLVFCGFVHGVTEEVQRSATERVFFLAREGDLFRVLYSKLAGVLANGAHSVEYLYVSRKSVLLPASWRGISRKTLDVLLCNPKQKGLFSVANALGIPADDFLSVARRFGLKGVDQPIVGWPDEKFKRLISDGEFQNVIVSHANPARLRLRRYLGQMGFFGRNSVALVDIGWNGTIQHFLREAFKEDAFFPHTAGLYLSFNDGFGYGFERDEAKGILYDNKASPLQHNVFALFEELFENSARASHGTTEGYHEDALGHVEPVLRSDNAADRRVECDYDKQTVALREGILDFADAYAKAISLVGSNFEDIRSHVMARSERCIVFPTHEEANHLLRMVHAEDLGSDNVMNFDQYRLAGPLSLLHPRRFLRVLRASNWKYGTARTAGLSGINHVLRLVELAITWARKGGASSPATPRPTVAERLLFYIVDCGGFPILNTVRKSIEKLWRR